MRNSGNRPKRKKRSHFPDWKSVMPKMLPGSQLVENIFLRPVGKMFQYLSMGQKVQHRILSTARVSLRKYFIPGCVGRGLDLDLRIRPAPTPAPAASGNPSGWAQAGPTWVGPSQAQVGGPKPGPSGWAHAGPKVGPSQKFGTQKIPKIKIIKIKIRSAQNVGKVFISRKKNLPPPFGPIWAHFLRGPEKSKKCQNFAYFPWWA